MIINKSISHDLIIPLSMKKFNYDKYANILLFSFLFKLFIIYIFYLFFSQIQAAKDQNTLKLEYFYFY